MTFMLPSPQKAGPSLADVFPSCLASMGVPSCKNTLGLRKVTSTIIVVVDGLGAQNLSAAKAHARFLSPLMNKASTLSTVFPSTTASALPSLTTGTLPGVHGMVGYRVREPESGLVMNQLTGLQALEGKTSWLLETPLYSRARDSGIRPVVVAKPRFSATPLTKLIHEGADLVGAATIGQRCDEALALVQASASVVIVYISELDELAHAEGVGSHSWASKLEEVDSELNRLAKSLAKDVALFVTADHGVIDIPAHSHVLFGETAESMAGIVAVGGEPRCLQLYVEEGADVDVIARSWHERFQDVAYVATRAAMVASGWLGEVNAVSEKRLGDIFVLARKDVVFFDAQDPTNKARNMIGHHGGISAAEMRIPFLRLN